MLWKQTVSATADGGSGRALWGVIRSETNKCMEVSGDPFAVLRRAVCGDAPGAGSGTGRRLADSLNEYYLSVVRDTPLRPSVPDAITLLAAAVPRVSFLVCLLATILAVTMAGPDGGETHPLPGPGLVYGGIPYGSVSGNVAEFFNKRAAPSGRSLNQHVDFSPIEQWLR